ncbi:hypothetical protein [Tengunoibacter tsumagoiensis]|uniref:Uncharacterized protein n=1 Tax=Tengunoibacter tsumagoiensis TaxID=2014871 RepID=A0A401ZY52_9CHLR|nr:hypothetical protein [Tengunoibacter tsumagoiensis]GCE11753.1 hypothetical protein KTT_16120 [Tengunoibacter tsumagoiensis]
MDVQFLSIKQLWLLTLEICLGLLIVALILEVTIDHPMMLADLFPTRPFELITLILSLMALFVGIIILCGEKVMGKIFYAGAFVLLLLTVGVLKLVYRRGKEASGKAAHVLV